MCFGGDAEYKDFELLRHTKQGYEEELTELRVRRAVLQEANGGERWNDNAFRGKAVNPAKYSYLSNQVEALDRQITARRLDALTRGRSPKNRAAECGRRWEDADGF